MSSRDYSKFLISAGAPANTQVGDEYYDPTTGFLYKNLGGGNFTQVLVSGNAANFNGGTVAGSVNITNYLVVANATSTLSPGVVEITGNADGTANSPNNLGVMLHVTGQTGAPARIYIDGQGTGNYSAIVGRRYNGTSASPTGLVLNDVVTRFGATPRHSTGWPSITTSRLDFLANEIQTSTALGSRAEIWVTPIGGVAAVKQITVDGTSTTFFSTASSTSTTTGALIVQGGVGVGGDVIVGGGLTATTLTTLGTNTFRRPSGEYFQITGSGASAGVSGSTNELQINGSGANAINIGSVGNPAPIILSTLGTEKLRVSATGISIPVTTASTSTNTGALQVAGGVGVGGNIYTAGRVGYVNTSNVSVVYQYYNTVTNSLDTVFG